MTIERTHAMPEPGVISAWDAGWNAHEVGIGREAVAVLTPSSGRAWALLGWDCRKLLADRETEQAA